MSIVASPTLTPASTVGSRIAAVVRLHFVNKGSVLYVPWMILSFIFLANFAIWWIILSSVTSASDRADVREGLAYSGASLFIFVYMMVVAVQAMNSTFSFAQGLSVTRRDYYLGTSVAFIVLAAVHAAVLTLMSFLEEATSGWGLGGQMFTAIYFGDGGLLERAFLFFVGFLFFFFVGAAVATVYVRWRSNGVLVFFAIIGVLLVAAVGLLTSSGSWGSLWSWFGSTGATGVAAWSLVPTLLAGVAGFFVLRRATQSSS